MNCNFASERYRRLARLMFDSDHENDWFAWEIIRISCNFKKLYQMKNLNRKKFSIFWAKTDPKFGIYAKIPGGK